MSERFTVLQRKERWGELPERLMAIEADPDLAEVAEAVEMCQHAIERLAIDRDEQAQRLAVLEADNAALRERVAALEAAQPAQQIELLHDGLERLQHQLDQVEQRIR